MKQNLKHLKKPVRMATCNILFDGEKPSRAGSWKERRPRLTELIGGIKPDILATQEGWQDQLQDLDHHLKQLDLVGEHRVWTQKMFPCLYINRDRFEVVDSRDRWLSETPETPDSLSFGSKWPKLCTLALVRDRQHDENEFVVGSFHLDNVSEKARPEQARVLLEQTKAFAQGKPHVLMGDANEPPDQKSLQLLTSTMLDVYGNTDAPPSFHGFGAIKCRIDYVLNCPAWEVGHRWTDQREDDWYSDHHLVFADLMLRHL
ncbi:MAG: endonuclease/exonuclease/phosphatase family protein [Pseudobacteriovorax sp.]|nr:endonuclease/exonuclease/phosphatase family protein [Pseudobacteriovorax sp.]